MTPFSNIKTVSKISPEVIHGDDISHTCKGFPTKSNYINFKHVRLTHKESYIATLFLKITGIDLIKNGISAQNSK